MASVGPLAYTSALLAEIHEPPAQLGPFVAEGSNSAYCLTVQSDIRFAQHRLNRQRFYMSLDALRLEVDAWLERYAQESVTLRALGQVTGLIAQRKRLVDAAVTEDEAFVRYLQTEGRRYISD